MNSKTESEVKSEESHQRYGELSPLDWIDIFEL